MKIAIVSVSDKGKKIGLNIKKQLDNDSTVIGVDLFHKNVKKYLKIFPKKIIFHIALKAFSRIHAEGLSFFS